MEIGIVGSGPAASAIEAALDDVKADCRRIDLDELASIDVGVVIGRTGDSGFRRANSICIGHDIPWLGMEVGGIGGIPVDDIDAAVIGFRPTGPCFTCLRTRIRMSDQDRAGSSNVDPTSVRFGGAIMGRRLARLVSGREQVPHETVIEIPHRTARLLPAPQCDDCGTDEQNHSTASLEFRDTELEATIDRAQSAVDPRFGIITEVGEVESFPAPYYLARTVSTTAVSDGEAPREAAGVAEDWDTAFMKCLGEALERYSGGIYRSESLVIGPATAVKNPLPFDNLARPTTPDRTEPIPWVQGTRYPAKEPTSVPAELAVFPPPDRKFGPAITTGLGLGSSGVEAALSGLYEVIERDATMIGWYSTYEPIELTVDDDRYDRLARRARSEGLSVRAVAMTQDVDVPVVAVGIARRDRFPRFAAGSAAHLDPTDAARSALSEAIQNWMELRSMGPDGSQSAGGWIGPYAREPPETPPFHEIDRSIAADRLGPEAVPEGRAAFTSLVDRITAVGMEPIVVQLTPRDVRSIGFEAVRVIVPSAQPLFTNSPYFSERLRSVPQTLGFKPTPDRDPHPFP